MQAAIYARYSSENQRPESIEDQVAACRRLATERGFQVAEGHVYSDKACSGARRDREGLQALQVAAEDGQFEVVLVDDLSRLARDNFLMLQVLAELHFVAIRVVSVADGLDSSDEEATLGIQIRGIFNELQLRDLKKKTLRGQIGQKRRGFSVGERTFGFRSVPVGEMRMDKKGRPRPEGYRMEIEPKEAAVVLRIFKTYADGQSLSGLVRELNKEGVPGRFRTSKGWSPATLSRMLDNEKYIGRWIWNRTESRRDPRTGRRRRFAKPESEWIVNEDEALSIVPQSLWESVRTKREAARRSWPGGKGKRGFSKKQGSRQRRYPTHLLSGGMVCGACGAAIAQVSGKSGGYYGCLGAVKGACENRMLVRRSLTERIILTAVQERLSFAASFREVLERVEREVGRLYANVPETVRLREKELAAEECRLDNFVDFIGEGRGSRELGKALVETERRVENLRVELEGLRCSREKVFQAPPIRPAHRSSLDTLRKLVPHNVYLNLEQPREDVIGVFPLDEVGETVMRLLADRFGADRERATRELSDEVERLLPSPPWSKLPAEERQACERWAPLVACLDIGSWSKPERKALFEVMRAKGGCRESDFVAKFDAHKKLRAAFRALLKISP